MTNFTIDLPEGTKIVPLKEGDLPDEELRIPDHVPYMTVSMHIVESAVDDLKSRQVKEPDQMIQWKLQCQNQYGDRMWLFFEKYARDMEFNDNVVTMQLYQSDIKKVIPIPEAEC